MSIDIPKCCNGKDHSSDYRVRFFNPPTRDDNERPQCGDRRSEKYVCKDHLAETCTENSFNTENDDRIMDVFGGEVYTSPNDALAEKDAIYKLNPEVAMRMASQTTE